MNLKKQRPVEQDSIGDEIQTGVDVILSILITAGKVAPVPFLSLAAESVQKIVETIDAIEENKGALEDLADDAKGLIAVLWGTYQQAHDQKNWPPEELRDVLEGLVSTLQDICRFTDDKLSRGLVSRIWHSKRDPAKLQKYKMELNASLERFKLCSHITLNEVVMQIKNSQDDIKTEAKNKREEEAIDKLQVKVAPGASYDCDARSTVPKCHPGTREAIRKFIKDWVKNSEDHPFLWMYGPAGCGKTTIMETIAKECDDEESLAASFFFSRSASDRPSENTGFVATLAYQLCLSITEIRPHIANTIIHDPNIFTKSLSGQMTELIIKPLNIITAEEALQKSTYQQRKVVVIDGLDECEGPNEKAQMEILDLLYLASSQLSFPLLFLIASRPENNTQTYFSSHQMNPLTKGLPLANDYRINDDIKIYLEARFGKIKETHPARDNIPKDWPARDDYYYLVKKASGQFIYVSVVMDFVESTKNLPQAQLRTVRDKFPHPENGSDETPFAPLDALYCHILSSVNHSHLKKALEIIRAMIFGRRRSSITLEIADRLFSQELGESRLILSGLRALIYLPDVQSSLSDSRPKSGALDSYPEPSDSDSDSELDPEVEFADPRSLRFFHTSFVDFLLDGSRSGEFFIEPADAHAILARHWIRYYNKLSLPSEIQEIQGQRPDISYLGFDMILYHCEKAILTPELQHDLKALPLLPVPTWLRVAGNGWKDSCQFWGFTFRILQFVCWLKHQNPDTEKDLYDQLLHRVKVSLRSEWLKYGSEVQKFIPLALTLPESMNSIFIDVAMDVIDTKFGYSDSDPLLLRYFNFDYHLHRFEPATMLLCQVLTDFKLSITEHTGEYTFDDPMQYTEFALMVAESILPPDAVSYKELETRHSSLHQVATMFDLILTKAAPHPKLAQLLQRKALQLDLQLLPNTPQFRDIFNWEDRYHDPSQVEKDRAALIKCLKNLSVNNLLYIKRSGIRLGEHTHPPKFDPAHWCCAICIAEEDGIKIPPDPPAYPLPLAIPDSRFIQEVLIIRMLPVIVLAGGIWFGLRRFFLVR